MKKLSILLIVVLCLTFLAGCWDKRELEDNTFAILVGIDKADNEKIAVTIAFPLTQTGGDSGENKGDYSVETATAASMDEGLTMLSARLSETLALHAVKTLVISKELAQDAQLKQVFSSWSSDEIRNVINLLVSECKASEFIEARVKEPKIDPLRQEELLLEQINSSNGYSPTRFLDFLAAVESDSGDTTAIYGIVEGEDDKKECRISGLALFHGAMMTGVLRAEGAEAVSALTKSEISDTISKHAEDNKNKG